MRVAHVTPVYPPVRGGIGTAAAEYARGLSLSGIDVEVFTPDYHHGAERDAGVHRLQPWYAWGFAALVPQLIWKLRGFDVIHLHHSFYGGEEAAAFASWIWRIPLVVTYHMQPKASGWVGCIMKLHRWCVEPLVMWRAAKILVSSRDYAEANRFANARRMMELPFGVDTKRFAPGDGAAFRLAHGIAFEKKVMLFVGGLASSHYFKGVEVLLAAAKLMERDASWHLVLVGDGDRRQAFAQQAQEYGLADRVTFAGSVHFSDLADAYRAADVHVLPSIDRSEAFGLVTLEAMATGIPSVVSDLPGMRTLISPGETGLLAPPGDAAGLAERLQELLQQDSRRKAMGAAARERALAKYAADVVITRLIDVYKEVRV